MWSSSRALLRVFVPVTLTLAVQSVSAATCSGARSVSLCAQFITPFSVNQFTWQSVCGLSEPVTDILMAQSIQFNSGTCPDGMTATCCTPCIACGNVGVDCDGPTTAAPPSDDGNLPEGWSVAVPCAVDNADRVLEDIVVTYLTTTTPLSCVEQCASQGFTFAGVEFSDECYCGTGYLDGVVPPTANVSDCNMPCAGDLNDTCGGSWRIQLYTST